MEEKLIPFLVAAIFFAIVLIIDFYINRNKYAVEEIFLTPILSPLAYCAILINISNIEIVIYSVFVVFLIILIRLYFSGIRYTVCTNRKNELKSIFEQFMIDEYDYKEKTVKNKRINIKIRYGTNLHMIIIRFGINFIDGCRIKRKLGERLLKLDKRKSKSWLCLVGSIFFIILASYIIINQ